MQKQFSLCFKNYKCKQKHIVFAQVLQKDQINVKRFQHVHFNSIIKLFFAVALEANKIITKSTVEGNKQFILNDHEISSYSNHRALQTPPDDDQRHNKDRYLTLHIHMRDGDKILNLPVHDAMRHISLGSASLVSDLSDHDDNRLVKRQVPCDEVECHNGLCTLGRDDTTPRCHCYEGFIGSKCEKLKLECGDNKWKCKGGSCENHHGTHMCRCDNGLVGLDCNKDAVINPCGQNSQISKVHGIRGFGPSMPNLFAHCLTNDTFLARKCPRNLFWDQEAETCIREQPEAPTGMCITYPCANGGKCLDHGNDFSCHCAPGFSGKDCSQKLDMCSINPCKGGRCRSWSGGYTCECPEKVYDKCCCNGVVNKCRRGIDFYAHNATSFVHCGPSGEAYLKSCPAGLIWRNDIKTCVRPDSYAYYTDIWDYGYRNDDQGSKRNKYHENKLTKEFGEHDAISGLFSDNDIIKISSNDETIDSSKFKSPHNQQQNIDEFEYAEAKQPHKLDSTIAKESIAHSDYFDVTPSISYNIQSSDSSIEEKTEHKLPKLRHDARRNYHKPEDKINNVYKDNQPIKSKYSDNSISYGQLEQQNNFNQLIPTSAGRSESFNPGSFSTLQMPNLRSSLLTQADDFTKHSDADSSSSSSGFATTYHDIQPSKLRNEVSASYFDNPSYTKGYAVPYKNDDGQIVDTNHADKLDDESYGINNQHRAYFDKININDAYQLSQIHSTNRINNILPFKSLDNLNNSLHTSYETYQPLMTKQHNDKSYSDSPDNFETRNLDGNEISEQPSNWAFMNRYDLENQKDIRLMSINNSRIPISETKSESIIKDLHSKNRFKQHEPDLTAKSVLLDIAQNEHSRKATGSTPQLFKPYTSFQRAQNTYTQVKQVKDGWDYNDSDDQSAVNLPDIHNDISYNRPDVSKSTAQPFSEGDNIFDQKQSRVNFVSSDYSDVNAIQNHDLLKAKSINQAVGLEDSLQNTQMPIYREANTRDNEHSSYDSQITPILKIDPQYDVSRFESNHVYDDDNYGVSQNTDSERNYLANKHSIMKQLAGKSNINGDSAHINGLMTPNSRNIYDTICKGCLNDYSYKGESNEVIRRPNQVYNVDSSAGQLLDYQSRQYYNQQPSEFDTPFHENQANENTDEQQLSQLPNIDSSIGSSYDLNESGKQANYDSAMSSKQAQIFRRYAGDDIMPAEKGFKSVQIEEAPVSYAVKKNTIPVKFIEYHY
ncbi:hypothetical protein GJ496_011240 [Pomphorhynchus laevis]|nr:hypothetical protein GJ496_011240 [Pomphorhynchus laevis]